MTKKKEHREKKRKSITYTLNIDRINMNNRILHTRKKRKRKEEQKKNIIFSIKF